MLVSSYTKQLYLVTHNHFDTSERHFQSICGPNILIFPGILSYFSLTCRRHRILYSYMEHGHFKLSFLSEAEIWEIGELSNYLLMFPTA